MSWNKPNTTNGRKDGARAKAKSPARGLIAGCIVIVGAAIAAWLLWPDSSAPKPKVKAPTSPSKIKEVTPAAVPKFVEKQPKEPEEPKEIIRKLPNGLLMRYHPDGSPAWAAPRQPPGKTFTNRVEYLRSREQEIFKHSADVEIAMMLNVEPGTQMVGSNDFAGFNERFQEALKEPITISADDDEDTKLLKKAVMEVRDDFRKRYNIGEDLAATMAQVRKDMQELGLYREELKQQIHQIAQSEESKEFTEKDYQDLIDAANAMLEDRGAKPLAVPAFIKYKFDKELQDEDGE